MNGISETMTWRLEQARPGDAGDLAVLHGACFERGWSLDDMAAYVADPVCLVVSAHRDAQIIGVTICRRAADEAEILTLAVLPRSRQQGVGRAMLGEAARRLAARGVRRVFLEVAGSNAAGRALYQGAGAKEVGRRAEYYRSDGDDALVMSIAVAADGALVDAP